MAYWLNDTGTNGYPYKKLKIGSLLITYTKKFPDRLELNTRNKT